MYYLYLDESGDLGDHVQSPGASRYFVIAVLEVVDDKNRKAIAKVVERTIKNKLHKKHPRKAKPITELKGTGTDLADKKYFWDFIESMKSGTRNGMRFLKRKWLLSESIPINKKRANPV